MNLSDYAKRREALLDQIASRLEADDRITAAWMTGSYGRGDMDQVSDLDVTVVIADDAAASLCAREWMIGPQTTPPRRALFSQFGEIALIHENHYNAPPDGTFTHVMYAPHGIMVDWVLRPQASAQHPREAMLLFDKVTIPAEPPTDPASHDDRTAQAAERAAFFWMMAAVTAKYIIRGDSVFVVSWLEELTRLANHIERLIEGREFRYQRGSRTQLIADRDGQIAALGALCERVNALLPGSAYGVVMVLLQLAHESG